MQKYFFINIGKILGLFRSKQNKNPPNAEWILE
jgi:hypothetical protein